MQHFKLYGRACSVSFYRSRNFRNAALTAASRLRGMGTRAPLRIHSSPAESWDAAARFTT